MRLDWATLANAAETTPQGLINLLGAGWDTGTRDNYPAPFAGALAIRLLFHRREIERSHVLTVEMVTEDGTRVMELTHEFSVQVQSVPASRMMDEIPYPIAINLSQLQVASPGRFAIEIFLDGNHLRTLPVIFVLPASQPLI